MEIEEFRDWLKYLPGKLNALIDTPTKQKQFTDTVKAAHQDQAVIDWSREYYSLDFLDSLEPPDTLTEKQKELAAFYILNELGFAIQNPQEAGGFWDCLNPDTDIALFRRTGFVKEGYPFTLISRIEDAIQMVKTALSLTDPVYIPSASGLIILQVIASAEAPLLRKAICHKVDEDIKSTTTVKKELAALESGGYICRPNGERSGYAATKKGIQHLEDKGIKE
ncbi:MAG: hypothetical protein GX841_10585 [Bacteroidales bacterium]|nr:hypothetical protein [Bacteroidales bacterium]NLW83592.1 hypothetical protein [Phycisphaerae bacterium]